MKEELRIVPQGDDDDSIEKLLSLRSRSLALRNASRSPNTLRAYANGWKHFAAFCERESVPTVPAPPEAVAAWIQDLKDQRKPRRTVEQYLGAVRYYHLREGYIPPTLAAIVKEAIGGFRRDVPKTKDTRRGLTVFEVERMADVCSTVTDKGIRDAALLAVGFYGGMRVSELAALTIDDLREDEHGFAIEITKGKTDQTGEGRIAALPPKPGRASCPVALLRAWLAVRGDHTGILFPSLRQLASVRRALVAMPGGVRIEAPMSRNAVMDVITQRAKEADIKTDGLSTHSLRIGFITEAKRAGATNDEIARQTGHKTHEMIAVYTRFISAFEGNAVMKL